MSNKSLERKVIANQKKLNEQRKKRGEKPLAVKQDPHLDKFLGRSIAWPAFLIVFIVAFVAISVRSSEFDAGSWSFWTITIAYPLLAVLFWFRRPYLAVGKDYVSTRRFTGDKRISAENVTRITLTNGSVMIEANKQPNWVFMKSLNVYPIAEMHVRLEKFAAQHGIELVDQRKRA